MNNTANYDKQANWNHTTEGNFTTVGSNGGPSSYGTYDQSGNIWEWIEIETQPNSFIGRRGGSFHKNAFAISSNYRVMSAPWDKNDTIGFRLASISNPLMLDNYIHIADEKNSKDSTGYGSVDYTYNISKYPLTNYEYTEFLNAIDPEGTNPEEAYNSKMYSSVFGGIIFIYMNSNGLKYITKPNMKDKPVNFISWFNCARYCNWLHNGKPIFTKTSDASDARNFGAYTVGTAVKGNTTIKNDGSNYHIPTENEWYKAAYYKKGSTNNDYWKYATQSNEPPKPVYANSIGIGSWKS